LQPNLGDTDEGGDMIAGQYVGSTDLTTAPDVPHTEGSDYQRPDFQPGTGAGTASAFLARMRRTNEGYDGSDGARTSWFPVQTLFGGVSSFNASYPNGGYPARATSIADARSALVVGPAFPAGITGPPTSPAIVGFTPFAVMRSMWPLPDGAAYDVDGAGNLTQQSPPSAKVGVIIATTSLAEDLDSSSTKVTVASSSGFPFDQSSSSSVLFSALVGMEMIDVIEMKVTGAGGPIWTVIRGARGTSVQPHSSGTPIILMSELCVSANIANANAQNPLSVNLRPSALGNLAVLQQNPSHPALLPTIVIAGYVPIYDDSLPPSASSGRLLGFGLVHWQVAAWSAPMFTLSITVPTTSYIAVQNASAMLNTPLPSDLIAMPSSVQQVFSANATITPRLLAPSLVRSVGLPQTSFTSSN